jgi:cholesterol transport system auxiliary component
MALVAGFSGCSSLKQAYPAKESFGLTTPEVAPAAGGGHEGVLRVERVRVAAPYDGRSFVYRLSDTRYETDYYNEFVAEPGRLLTGELVRSLGGAHVFTTVVDPAASADAKVRLETSVTELYGDYRDPAAPRAVVRARFLLLEERLESTGVIGEWNLEEREPLKSGDAAGLVEGWSRAWGKVVSALASDLAGAQIGH